MNAGRKYSLKEFIIWTRTEIYKIIPIAVIPTVVYQIFDCTFIAFPWIPIALIGTAAAFIVGFKNTQTYNRLWEARQIYGAIINSSRSFGIMVRDFIVDDENTRLAFINRHVAWLTALRFQLREPRTWENMDKSYNKEYAKFYRTEERQTNLNEELAKYLSDKELQVILTKKNKATQIIALQSENLKHLSNEGKIRNFEYVELSKRLSDLYDQQGKCERIKNFPYPRQFASINSIVIWLFVLLIPFGMLNEFQKLGDSFVWLTIPFTIVVGWVFVTMDRVGESTENPFEGSANDVPITAISRTIEIDLLDMFDQNNLPEPITPFNNILM
ncbi:multidrug transporter [Flavobacterium sp. NST-5]|uniref:Multidrug transporter n=1 Tax=Flavobacterium ichthyis TaxID=2698827 RepID=A0ABW9Z6R4_9FLAO|nr:bestrophin family ion channel [Flavobacterium ichthyis]NBL64359.1 multidrug transporter [Flavobacterium ichthyis]